MEFLLPFLRSTHVERVSRLGWFLKFVRHFLGRRYRFLIQKFQHLLIVVIFRKYEIYKFYRRRKKKKRKKEKKRKKRKKRKKKLSVKSSRKKMN